MSHEAVITRPSGEAMNAVYDALKLLPNDVLSELWRECDPYTLAGLFLRHQLSYVLEKRSQGLWIEENSNGV